MSTTALAIPVVVTNNGAGTVTISNVSVGNIQFAQTNNCTTVAPAAMCTIQVAFTPAIVAGDLNAEFPVSSQLTITSDAPGSPNNVPLSGIAERSLITHYYQAILQRAPDPGGKTFWPKEATRVAGLDANVNETWFAMAQFFYFSAEYVALSRDSALFVTDLYNTFFNRPPDQAGLDFWVDQIAQGMPREVVLASFMFSTEFRDFTTAIFGNPTVRPETDLVMDFYRGFLARLPDDGGLSFYAERIRAEQCRATPNIDAILNDMFYSFTGAEYQNRLRTNAQFVGDLYNAILRRGGDLDGVLFWIDQLGSGALNREQVAREFLASPEFVARLDSVEATGCVSRGTNAEATGSGYTSVAFGGDGLPIIVHRGVDVARCPDAACAGGIQNVTVDGPFSNALMRAGRGADGLPFVGYSSSSLYSVKCQSPSCAGLNSYSFLQGSNVSGLSLLDGFAAGDDKPLFVYSAPGLIVEKCADAACSASSRTGFGSGTRGGVVLAGGLPLIAYAPFNAGMRVIKCGNAACTSGNTVSVVDTEVSVETVYANSPESAHTTNAAVGVGGDGLPVLAYGVRISPTNFYLNVTRRATKFVKCGNATCSSGNVVTDIDASLDGALVSMVVPPDGRPIVAYRTNQSTAKVVRCGNPTCTLGNTATTLPGIGYPVRSVNLTLSPSGKPFLALTSGDDPESLKTLACTNIDCR